MDTTTIEKAILGYIVIENNLDSSLLSETEFNNENNKLIYRAIQTLKKRGEIADFVTLDTELEEKVEPTYIASLTDGLPRVNKETHFARYINLLIRCKKEQEAKKLASEAMTKPNFIPRLQEILEGLKIETLEPIEDFTIALHVDKLTDYINKRISGEAWGLKVKSFPRLTKILMGLRESMVLTAGPKVGKSTFALQVASEIADQGAGVIYYDFENGRLNLMIRQLCRKHNIQYREELLNCEHEDRERIIQGLAELKDYKNFVIITDRKLTIEKMKSQISQLRKTTEQDHIFIVIDSLQKLPMKDLRDRRAAIDKWLRDFEELKAEDPYLTILMISETARGTKLPKESGDIEYTGHFLLRLEKHQDESEAITFGDDMIRILHLDYARDVQSGTHIAYKADFSRWKFEELSYDEQQGLNTTNGKKTKEKCMYSQ